MHSQVPRGRLVSVLILGVVVSLIGGRAWAEADPASLAQAVPSNAAVFVEVADFGQLIREVRQSALLQEVLASPQYQDYTKTKQYGQAQAGRQLVEKQLQMDLWTAVEKLLGHRIAVALFPVEGRRQPDGVLVVRVSNADALEAVRQAAEPWLKLSGIELEQSETLDGAKTLTVRDQFVIATKGDWLAAASNKELLGKVGDLLRGKGKDSLAGTERFQQITKRLGKQHLVTAFVNTEAVSAAAGGRFAPQKLDNAVGSLLFAGVLEMAVKSPSVGLSLDAGANGAKVTLSMTGDSRQLGETYASFFSDPKGAGTPPLPRPEGAIGGFTFHRKLARWYQDKEKLHQEKILPEFDKFETGINNLLPGTSFADDVLSLFGEHFTFISARQDYSLLDGKPGVQVPAFAVIADLSKPKEGSDMLQLFFNTFVSVINLQVAQNGGQPWLLSLEQHQEVPITYARYLQKPKGDKLPIVYNFSPASALVGRRYIISSSLGLCKDLIEEIKKQEANPRASNCNFELAIFPEGVVSALQDNRALLQARLIQDGRTEERATGDLDYLLKTLKRVRSLGVRNSVKENAFDIELEVTWQ